MKKINSAVLSLIIILSVFSGCGYFKKSSQYTVTYYDVFDTVTTIIGVEPNEKEFREREQIIHNQLLYYHKLFDIYNDYNGLNNIKTINDFAGVDYVTVEQPIIELLSECKYYYELTSGRVNVLMGSVLLLWHNAREDSLFDPENSYLPDQILLEEASRHISIDNLLIDESASAVFLRSENARLDVGAVAKGWAARQIAEELPSGYLINIGGNVCTTGPKNADGVPWIVGIEHPDGNGYLHTVYSSGNSVVTSGDYQRFYCVDDIKYHHIIDPFTLYPADYWRSVTVICEDSALADALSTALFLIPFDEGLQLAKSCDAEAVWMAQNGELFYSEGFSDLIKD